MIFLIRDCWSEQDIFFGRCPRFSFQPQQFKETEVILHLRECCHVLEAFGRACPSIYDGFFWDLHILVNVHIGTHFAWDDWQIAYEHKCGSYRNSKKWFHIVCHRYASKWAHYTFSMLFDRCWTQLLPLADYTSWISCISLRNPLKI